MTDSNFAAQAAVTQPRCHKPRTTTFMNIGYRNRKPIVGQRFSRKYFKQKLTEGTEPFSVCSAEQKFE